MTENYNYFFINQMMNAIQLCIKTLVVGHAKKDDDLIIKLGTQPNLDKGFEYFKKIVPID